MSGFVGGVIVSGASRGLGAALARRFAAPGVTLGLLARGEAGLHETAAACAARGATVRIAAVDVRDAEEVARTVLKWDAAVPTGLVVANAGIAAGRRPDGSAETAAEAASQVSVNLLGAIHLVGPLLPAIHARGAGRIGLVTSLAAFRGLPDSPGYSASKAGLWAWGEAIRADLAGTGAGVTLIAPGFFDSAMGDAWVGARPFSLSTEEAAARIERALRAGRASCVFPLPLAAGLRALALLPTPLADRAVRLLRFRIRP
ncbi:SDR family NAD(P)-dependent oxidoreductase [Roseomonas xinghualingensis]|uniref:SDR family NAD(P)-dependent oxidoreductase n=1 Tax=Roseomonas xinghualingensis TaxID=2986475 RepID=UPI0021F10A5D|nr:SDR family NAD(P)-dependent oxidoreductase [Roseomonas sp. SXEYE001]MCV4207785.1 SDR family NAD(P)-dependent oxidoreductase [Roseomonas sp. SXEYE001]